MNDSAALAAKELTYVGVGVTLSDGWRQSVPPGFRIYEMRVCIGNDPRRWAFGGRHVADDPPSNDGGAKALPSALSARLGRNDLAAFSAAATEKGSGTRGADLEP